MPLQDINPIVIEPSYISETGTFIEKNSVTDLKLQVHLAEVFIQIRVFEMDREEIIEKKESPEKFRAKAIENPNYPLMFPTGPRQGTNSTLSEFSSLEETLDHNRAKIFADQSSVEEWGKLNAKMQKLLWRNPHNLNARQKVKLYVEIKNCINDYNEELDSIKKLISSLKKKEDTISKSKTSRAYQRAETAFEDLDLLEEKAKEVKNSFGRTARIFNKITKTLMKK